MRRVKQTAVGAIFVVAALAIATLAVGAPGEKHIICHFDGQAGTIKYQKIECGSGCLNGHVENDGTLKAGHELDVIDPPSGLCPDEPEPRPTPEPSPTPEP